MKNKKNIQKYPSISILTLTYNPNLYVFKKSLESIKKQNYPKEKVEHIVIDGGSSRNVLRLAKEFGCKILIKKHFKDNSEGRRSFGVEKAKNEIILWLESDNILPDALFFKKLTKPLEDDPRIFSTFTSHYGYKKSMNPIDKYFSLIGVGDPVVFYLGKSDRQPWSMGKYPKGKIIYHKDTYDVVEFNESNLPTVGDNGFFVKREILQKAKVSAEHYFHTDVFVDLLKLGYNRFGIVHSASVEHIGEKNIFNTVQKRVSYMKRDASRKSLSVRRYKVFNGDSLKDMASLILFILYTVTILQPLVVSIKGYVRLHDKIWFLHPLVCWIFLVYYAKANIELFFEKN